MLANRISWHGLTVECTWVSSGRQYRTRLVQYDNASLTSRESLSNETARRALVVENDRRAAKKKARAWVFDRIVTACWMDKDSSCRSSLEISLTASAQRSAFSLSTHNRAPILILPHSCPSAEWCWQSDPLTCKANDDDKMMDDH